MAALGTYQATLFAQGEPAVVAGAAVQRLSLDDFSWVDPARASLIDTMVGWLEGRYGADINANFVNYYRDSNDSVAWHADRIGLERIDPIVAICSLGGPRRFSLRPMTGGPSVRLTLGSGDLLAMGGACQHAWEHCVPKMATAAPRMSLTFRHVDDSPGEDWWYGGASEQDRGAGI